MAFFSPPPRRHVGKLKLLTGNFFLHSPLPKTRRRAFSFARFCIGAKLVGEKNVKNFRNNRLEFHGETIGDQGERLPALKPERWRQMTETFRKSTFFPSHCAPSPLPASPGHIAGLTAKKTIFLPNFTRSISWQPCAYSTREQEEEKSDWKRLHFVACLSVFGLFRPIASRAPILALH